MSIEVLEGSHITQDEVTKVITAYNGIMEAIVGMPYELALSAMTAASAAVISQSQCSTSDYLDAIEGALVDKPWEAKEAASA